MAPIPELKSKPIAIPKPITEAKPLTPAKAPVPTAKPAAVKDGFTASPATLAAPPTTTQPAKAGETLYTLKGDATLDQVASGTTVLNKGAKGEPVTKVQEALIQAGYKLPKFGADGDFGGETQTALKKFQTDAGMKPPSGVLDAQTLKGLEAAAAKKLKFPEYDRMFKDGVLNSTIGVGYDEAGYHKPEINKIVTGLVGDGTAANKGQGYTQFDPKNATDDQLKKVGIDPAKVDRDAQYFVKTFQHDGKDVKAVVKLITPDTPNAKEKFAKAMAEDEMVTYAGHGRYGSGPDFDDINSTAGNVVLGKPYEQGHVKLGDNDLKKMQMTNDYQLMMFSGCTTNKYLDDLRSVPKNKNTKNLDVVASTDLLYWNNMGDNALTQLEGVTSGRSMNEIQSNLERINKQAGKKSVWTADGFRDN